MSSFVFGENNSSFDYDNKFDRLMRMLENIHSELRISNNEVSELRAEIKNLRPTKEHWGPL
jgi:archaellum component FlaC